MRLLSPLLLAVKGLHNSDLIDPILNHPAISALSIDIRPRSRLKNKHKIFFANESTDKYNTLIFDELALVVCSTSIVCRKELFETYAAAIYIHAKFPSVKRVADLAAGHGLLSWFLLVLDEYGNNPGGIIDNNDRSSFNSSARTAVCVDRRMPSSADKIASAMIDRFPELEPRWSYIQSDLNAVVPDPSCLLTSVHACGTLTDYLIELAIGDSFSGECAPLAVVPCCHTVKERNGYRPHPLSGMGQEEVSALLEENKKQYTDNLKKHQVIADTVDKVRCETLTNAGFDVEEVMLPESFTLRNRLLLGEPGINARKQSQKIESNSGEFFQRKPSAHSVVSIPLADDRESISQCKSISGRERATARLIQQIPKHFSPSLVLSIWLSELNLGLPLSLDDGPSLKELLQIIANRCCAEIKVNDVECDVEVLGDANLQPTTGRESQRFQFTYKRSKQSDISVAAVSKDTAKKIHNSIRETILDELGENVLR